MKHITFATGNAGKVTTLQNYLKRANVGVVIEQRNLDLIEPQADTAQEIAIVKARQAWQQLGKPVLVDDSSFHVTALKGFPGPYIKPMLTTIGVEGIIELLSNTKDRSAYFLSSLVFIDEVGKEHTFQDDPYTGVIANDVSKVESSEAWSDLFKVFIPDGHTKVLAEMSIDERHAIQLDRVDSYGNFVEWLKNR